MLEVMDPDQIRRRAPVLWLFMGLLVVLVCVLAILQYNWIGEISANEQKLRQADLQTAANKLSSAFNAEINAATQALQPDDSQVQELGSQKAYETRYLAWRASATHPRLFRRAAMVGQENGRLVLRMFNTGTGALETAEWPADWIAARDFVTARLAGNNVGRNNGPQRADNSTLIDYPRFLSPPDPNSPRGPEVDWLLLDLDSRYVAEAIIPELLTQYFTEDFGPQYRVEVAARGNPSKLIFATDASNALSAAGSALATATLFDPPRGGRGRGAGPGPGPVSPPPPSQGPPPGDPGRGVSNDSGRGRWLLSVWLRNGSLDAAVSSARHKNLAISGGILLLLLATGAALAQFSRRAQQLAQVEMEFVAGVSHELRTPLTVIRTAAFNLRGKVASNPSQVERYGALIQQESERLGAIVEQVLRFASAQAGRVVQERQPVSVAGLIEETLQSNKGMLEDALCQVEARVEPGLPPIAGDSVALRHALQNLLANAAKYGGAGKQSVAISARSVAGAKGSQIEIRVTDHGVGIPPEEQKHVFDAFFRGRKAVQDQIHGTGLGLHLVKRIVEAHGGTVSLESELGAGSTFIVRIPAAPAERQNELAPSLG
jgi:signal transduction histidine kinase